LKKAAFLNNDPDRLNRVFADDRRQRIESMVELYPATVSESDFQDHIEQLQDLQVIFSTWGMVKLGPYELDQLPALEAIFYAAGSVQSFARPILERNILLVSTWAANAAPVAEFALAQILLSCKGYFRCADRCTTPAGWKDVPHGPGAFGESVGLIGMGMVGRRVAQLLKPFDLKVVVHDPYLSDADAAELGVEPLSLEELFARALVVSNHLPDLSTTRGMLNAALFASMREGSTFINTGRGAQVVETELVEVLERRPDLTALLDVTFPEPPAEGSPLFSLPNLGLSPHIAGSKGDEIVRQADYAIAEFERWLAGEPLKYQVTLEMLETMA
jgi:phosphoglycerate dehydrogenase-like enzyme